MFSLSVGPSQGTPDAVADLRSLLTTNPKFHEEWLNMPITRMVVAALDQASRGRAPHTGLQITDYAHAAGEIVGFQRAVIALKDPNAFLEQLGAPVGAKLEPLPPPSYMAPEPPPETKGEKKE